MRNCVTFVMLLIVTTTVPSHANKKLSQTTIFWQHCSAKVMSVNLATAAKW